jgi:hypothetical protein
VLFDHCRTVSPNSALEWFALGFCVVFRLLLPAPVLGQTPATVVIDIWEKCPDTSELVTALCGGGESPSTAMDSRLPRIPMYRMLPGFLSDPANVPGPDDNSGDAGHGTGDGVLVNFGDDNPYFDPRRPGDPGGMGYYRIFSQMQLLDTGSTSVCLGMKAWTPASISDGGTGEGHTFLAPGLGVFQDLGYGTGLHGYVGQQVCADLHGGTRQSALECGMALQCPVPGLVEPTNNGVFLYVQALGRYGCQNYNDAREMELDLVPGVHWRVSDNFWMSLGASHGGLLTCAWQY